MVAAMYACFKTQTSHWSDCFVKHSCASERQFKSLHIPGFVLE